MEYSTLSKVFLVLVFATAINSQDYFAGLNIDPTLI
jgi:hypothetical protein